MRSQEEGAPLSPRVAFAAAGASFAVAVLELRVLPIQGTLPQWVSWLMEYLFFAACAVFALLALRQHMRGTIHANTIRALLLYICVVYGVFLLIRFVYQLAYAGIVSSPPALWVHAGMMALSVSAAASFAYAAFRTAQSDVADARWLALFAALAALRWLVSFSSDRFMVSTGIVLGAAAYLTLAVCFIRIGRETARGGPRSTAPAIHLPKRGAATFAAIVGGIAATGSILLSMNLRSTIVVDLTVAFLMAPANRTLDSWGLPDTNLILLFLLTLPYLMVLLAPTGLRLIFAWPGRLWVSVLLQVLFLLGYLVMSFALIIDGIQG